MGVNSHFVIQLSILIYNELLLKLRYTLFEGQIVFNKIVFRF